MASGAEKNLCHAEALSRISEAITDCEARNKLGVSYVRTVITSKLSESRKPLDSVAKINYNPERKTGEITF